MTEREIRVSFKKQLNDGNYGGETAEVTISDFIEDTDDDDYAAEEARTVKTMLMAARGFVHGELYRSPSPRVRGALAPVPGPHPSAIDSEYEDEGDEAPLPL